MEGPQENSEHCFRFLDCKHCMFQEFSMCAHAIQKCGWWLKLLTTSIKSASTNTFLIKYIFLTILHWHLAILIILTYPKPLFPVYFVFLFVASTKMVLQIQWHSWAQNDHNDILNESSTIWCCQIYILMRLLNKRVLAMLVGNGIRQHFFITQGLT